MEVQFAATTYPYLKTVAQGRQIREEVQQIKLPDSFPDIGRVVDCSGQVLVRGKEWRSDGIRVSGGVMVWVLYAPEDGSELKSVEGWIPFQGKWEIRDSKRDGSICFTAHIQSMDARSVSARKLMVRCSVCMAAEAMEPESCQILQPENLPEGVQLLTNTYPLEVPLEAGEKLVQMEETIEMTGEPIQKILASQAEPVIQECKIMANRLVFRGKIKLHVLYCGEGGSIKAFDGEIPFSQYTDLDHEFTESAAAMVLPALTTLEMEWEEGVGLSCKCSIAAQYIVYDRRNLSVIEDAYCPGRQVSLQREHLSVPVRLDVLKQDLRMEQRAEGKGKILSAQLIVDSPEVMQVSDTAEIRVPGIFRLLTQDPDGNYAVQTVSAEEKWEIMSDTDNRLRVCTSVSESPSTAAGDDTLASGVVQMEVHVLSQQAFSVVSEIQLGDMQPLDPKRPSLILCRADGADLWQIAKRYGSTVEALRSANGITDQPEPDRLLLIPIA